METNTHPTETNTAASMFAVFKNGALHVIPYHGTLSMGIRVRFQLLLATGELDIKIRVGKRRQYSLCALIGDGELEMMDMEEGDMIGIGSPSEITDPELELPAEVRAVQVINHPVEPTAAHALLVLQELSGVSEYPGLAQMNL